MRSSQPSRIRPPGRSTLQCESTITRYLIRLADKCGVDLPVAAARKLQKNAAKYPADLVRR